MKRGVLLEDRSIVIYKKVIILMLCFLLILELTIASPTNKNIEETFNIIKTNPLKTYYKEVGITLKKEGVFYKEINKIFYTNEKGFVIFLLPEGYRVSNLQIYDLTNNRGPLKQYYDITKLKNCLNYYSLKKIKNSDTLGILVCPNNNEEIQLEINALLYHKPIPDYCGEQPKGTFYTYIPEIVAGIKPYLTDDFEIKFGIFLDKELLGISQKYKINCKDAGLNEESPYFRDDGAVGATCYGKPYITEALVFTNISLKGRDISIVKKEEENWWRKWDFIWFILIGVFGGIIGTLLINFFNKQIKSLWKNNFYVLPFLLNQSKYLFRTLLSKIRKFISST